MLSLCQGNCPRVSSISDKNGWKVVRNALTIIGFNEEEIQVHHTQTHWISRSTGVVRKHTYKVPLLFRSWWRSWPVFYIWVTCSLVKMRRERHISPLNLNCNICPRWVNVPPQVITQYVSDFIPVSGELDTCLIRVTCFRFVVCYFDNRVLDARVTASVRILSEYN